MLAQLVSEDGSKLKMNSRPSFALLLLALCASAAAAHEKPWTEIRSPHFRVLTDGSPSDARKVAHEFEQMRNVFATHLTNARLESGAPLLIFAVLDEETAKALEPRIWKTGANRAGEYHHGWEKQFAIVRLDTWGREGAKPVVYHEYTHSIEHMNSHWLPVWFDEGTAEFYGFTRFEAHRTYIGAPTERVKTLRESTPLPVETFIGIDHRSPYYLDGSKNQLFYTEAWALVHMLTYGPGMENGKRLAEFLNLLQQGVEQKKAFQQVFGDFKKVDRALESYMKQPTFVTTVLKDPEQIDDQTFSSRTLTMAETEAELGGFHLWTRDLEGARTLLEQALKDEPKLGLAHENMGFLDFAEGNDSSAAQEFSQAYRLDGTLYLSLFAKTMLSSLPASHQVSDLNAFGAALGKVLQLNPLFASAYVQLARLAVRENDLQSALLISRKAEELEPSLAGYHLLTGQILQRLGKNVEAATDARFVADRWIGPDHDEAAELWNKLPPDQRSPGETISEMVPEGTQTVEGLVESVTCGDQDKWALVLDHDGHLLTFHRKGNFAAGFSDTLWYGADHFTLCHHLEGLRAVVRYHAPSDATYGGDVAEIEIRDDLPAPLKETVASSPP
jgi:tetratricopeptide (TPR) repeat protein